MAQCQHSMYTSTALQEDDIPENQTNIYSREGTLSSELNEMGEETRGFQWKMSFALNLKI